MTKTELLKLEHLGLTPREAEVLAWVAQGKSNGDIGVILGISPRTVQKHAERIYEKLGVETRTAAAARLWSGGSVPRAGDAHNDSEGSGMAASI